MIFNNTTGMRVGAFKPFAARTLALPLLELVGFDHIAGQINSMHDLIKLKLATPTLFNQVFVDGVHFPIFSSTALAMTSIV